jgi:hypothetical protein
MICAWSWFSVMAGVVSRALILPTLQLNMHTIASSKSISHPPVHVIVHPLNHGTVPLKVIPNFVTWSAAALQAVNLLLALLAFELRLFKILAQLLDLIVLLRVALLLFVLLAAVGDTFPEAHGRREGPHER